MDSIARSTAYSNYQQPMMMRSIYNHNSAGALEPASSEESQLQLNNILIPSTDQLLSQRKTQLDTMEGADSNLTSIEIAKQAVQRIQEQNERRRKGYSGLVQEPLTMRPPTEASGLNVS